MEYKLSLYHYTGGVTPKNLELITNTVINSMQEQYKNLTDLSKKIGSVIPDLCKTHSIMRFIKITDINLTDETLKFSIMSSNTKEEVAFNIAVIYVLGEDDTTVIPQATYVFCDKILPIYRKSKNVNNESVDIVAYFTENIEEEK